jgi:putative heme iron utilization protein
MQSQDPFPPDVVAAVMRHMNEDHGADSLVICQGLGGQPGASSALMSGMDADGIDFVAIVDGGEVTVRLPWSERLTERAQIRTEVTRIYHDARAALGLAPVGGEA